VMDERSAYSTESGFLRRRIEECNDPEIKKRLERRLEQTLEAITVADFVERNYPRSSHIYWMHPGHGLRAIAIGIRGIDSKNINISSEDSEYSNQLNAALTAWAEYDRYVLQNQEDV